MNEKTDAGVAKPIADISFKVDRCWHDALKLRALKERISMTMLFKKSVAFYIDNNPL